MAGRLTLGPDNSLTLSVGGLSQPLNITAASLGVPSSSAAETAYGQAQEGPYVNVIRSDGRHYPQYEGPYDDLPLGVRTSAAMQAVGVLGQGAGMQQLGLGFLQDGGLGSGLMTRSMHGEDDPDFEDNDGSDDGGDDDGSRGSNKRPRVK